MNRSRKRSRKLSKIRSFVSKDDKNGKNFTNDDDPMMLYTSENDKINKLIKDKTMLKILSGLDEHITKVKKPIYVYRCIREQDYLDVDKMRITFKYFEHGGNRVKSNAHGAGIYFSDVPLYRYGNYCTTFIIEPGSKICYANFDRINIKLTGNGVHYSIAEEVINRYLLNKDVNFVKVDASNSSDTDEGSKFYYISLNKSGFKRVSTQLIV